MIMTRYKLMACALLLCRSGLASTVTPGDPQAGGIHYAWTVEVTGNDNATLQDACGGWSWEDQSLFSAGETPVGWTHTSKWVALTVTEKTVLTLNLAPDATVPDGQGAFHPSEQMAPSFTLWRNWDNDDGDEHTYPNRQNVPWAEDLVYLDHLANSTNSPQKRSWVLEPGQYTLVLGSNAASQDSPADQGFSATITTAKTAAVDVGAPGGVGYSYTVVAEPGQTGNAKNHTGAWSWSDTSPGFNPDGSQGWTHTSRWLAMDVTADAFVTITMERDATVPFTGMGNVGGFAAVDQMFPSFTLYRGWDNDGGDNHTYNNRGRVLWAEDLTYMDHINNSSETTISRTWFLPAGKYTVAMGGNAPSETAPPRQGFKFTWAAVAGSIGVGNADPAPGGIGYSHTIVAGASATGSLKNHTGAWSWEDQNVAPAGGEGWTHTSRWVALQLTEPATFTITMGRDATVPFAGAGNVGGFAAVDHMFPSLTLYKGWDNDGTDFHTYPNRANVPWAEDITYFDHIDNATAETITRSWTLPAGNYTFALGSNSPSESNPPRQGFSFSYTTTAPQYAGPVITKQPKNLAVLGGADVKFSVSATGPGLVYQWYHNGVKLIDKASPVLGIDDVTGANAGTYTVEVRNAAGWLLSSPVTLVVTEKPVMNMVNLPDINIGQSVNVQVTATNNPTGFVMTGRLPKGVSFNKRTGLISGRALQAGDFNVAFKAFNQAGQSVAAASDTMSVTGLQPFHTGTFTGLLGRSPFSNDNLGGHIRITVTPVGGFTGTLKLGTLSYPLKGVLDTTTATLAGGQTIERPGRAPLTLTFTIPPTHRLAIGQVADAGSVMHFVARNADADAASFAGYHTLALKVIEQDAQNSGNPSGHGYGTFTVSSAGIATGFLMLADETKVTFSAPVETNGSLGLYALLYRNGGSVLAQLYMDKGASNNLAASYIDWLKKPEPASSRSLIYKNGFGPLSLDVVGRKYTAPSSGIPLNATVGSQNGTIKVDSTPTRISTNFTVSGARVVTFEPPNPNGFSLSFTIGTGLFKGGFTDGGRSVKFNGVIVDMGTAQQAFGTFLIPESTAAGAARHSRSVEIEARTPTP